MSRENFYFLVHLIGQKLVSIKSRSNTTEQLLKDAISHYSDLRKTGANPDYDQTQKTHISHPR
ncbi:hypothetical protein ABEB36_008240 [Hypothenemus hampei]|uniref:Uncharacterized protein n=1 Tax=Hypothenemus hampei TaxID=57062 RepID=A0ABD1ENE6_HYPHA